MTPPVSYTRSLLSGPKTLPHGVGAGVTSTLQSERIASSTVEVLPAGHAAHVFAAFSITTYVPGAHGGVGDGVGNGVRGDGGGVGGQVSPDTFSCFSLVSICHHFGDTVVVAVFPLSSSAVGSGVGGGVGGVGKGVGGGVGSAVGDGVGGAGVGAGEGAGVGDHVWPGRSHV